MIITMLLLAAAGLAIGAILVGGGSVTIACAIDPYARRQALAGAIVFVLGILLFVVAASIALSQIA